MVMMCNHLTYGDTCSADGRYVDGDESDAFMMVMIET